MIEFIKKVLKENNYLIHTEIPIPYGYRIRLVNGCIINIYPHKFKYYLQGKNTEKVGKLLKEKINENNKETNNTTTNL